MKYPAGLARNFSFLLIEKISVLATNLLLVLLLPKFLGYFEFTEIITAFSIASTTWVFINLGFDVKIIKEAAFEKGALNICLPQILFLKLMLSIIILVSIVLLISLSPYSDPLKECVYILLLSIFLMNFAESFQSVFKGFEKMQISTIILTISNVVIIALFLHALMHGHGITAVAEAYCIGRIVFLVASAAIYLKLYGPFKFKLNIRECPKILYDSVTRIPGQFFLMNLYNQAVIACSILYPQSTGNVGLAAKIMGAVFFIMTGFFEAVLPIMSKNGINGVAHARKNFSESLRILMILAAVLIVGIVLLGQSSIAFLWGAEYEEASGYLLVFSTALPFLLMLTLYQYYLASIDKQVKYFYYLTSLFVLNMPILLASHGIFGLTGLLWGITLSSVFFAMLIYTKFERKDQLEEALSAVHK